MSSAPDTKRQKVEGVGLAQQQRREKEALRLKHEQERKDLKARQARELSELEETHRKAISEEKMAAVRKEAGTEDAEDVCATCGTVVTDDNIDDCFCCGLCDTYHCNKHKSDMTTCVECDASYCKSCLGTMNVCSGCQQCPQLTCCNLKEMPCGEYESGDCEYYHHKYCRCKDYPNQRWKW